MKKTQLIDINALAHRTAIGGMHGNQWLENELFDLIVEYGEIEIAEDYIYFEYNSGNLELTIWSENEDQNKDREEVNIDVSELDGRISQLMDERNKFDNEVKGTNNSLNMSER